ncbi:1991_t:CDS:2, partial [Cetraspora pellucida]
DECMFFGPTLLELGKEEYENRMHVLCLSIGNESGLGKIRKKELEASCTSLGIDVKFVRSLDHPELQDGPKNGWNPVLISSIIEEYVEKHGIDVVITFDDKGISGHPNHSAAYNENTSYEPNFHDKINKKNEEIIEKEENLLNLPNSLLFVSTLQQFIRSRKSMKCHKSQLVWFRYLYIFFSRYMVINHLEKVE